MTGLMQVVLHALSDIAARAMLRIATTPRPLL